MIGGGLVRKAVPYPRVDGAFALLGDWTPELFSRQSDGSVSLFRGDDLIAVGRVVAVDRLSTGTMALVIRPSPDWSADLGNSVLVYGESRFSRLKVDRGEFPAARTLSGELLGLDSHPVLVVWDGGAHRELVVFHGPEARVPNDRAQTVMWRSHEYQIEVSGPFVVDDGDFFVELKLDGTAVSLQWLLQTLNPARSFALDAGQELLFRERRPVGGRRLKATYECFEPRVAVAPGSVEVRLYPAIPGQSPLLADLREPLTMLEDLLRAAAEGNPAGAIAVLNDRVFSVEELIKKAVKIAKAARGQSSLAVSGSRDRVPAIITHESAKALEDALERLEVREVERSGILYAVETVRLWCRVASDHGEDWTLRVPQEFQDNLGGNVPRRVRVVFRTTSLEGAVRGTGVLMGIEDSIEGAANQ